MPKLQKKRPAKKRRPCLFVDYVDIHPRQKQFPSAYEQVLVVSHLPISTEQISEESASPIPSPEPQDYFISRAYNKVSLAKTAIQYFLQASTIYTYETPALDINASIAQDIPADILPIPNIDNYNYIKAVSYPELTHRHFKTNTFRKIRHRIIAALLNQLRR